MMPMKVSVVIRCFNEEAHIGRLLTGILKQTRPADQIVIVDSGSTDATLAIASRFPVEVHSIEPASFSFGRSLNLGCQAALGDLIVIASAHVYPLYDTWLEQLTAPFRDSDVALAYGRQEGNEHTKYSERRVLARWFPPESVARQEHAFANNANAAIRRSVWLEQPYDERLTGLEDVDWARRAADRGHAIAYVATAPGRACAQRKLEPGPEPVPPRGDRPPPHLSRASDGHWWRLRDWPSPTSRATTCTRGATRATRQESSRDSGVPERAVHRHISRLRAARRGIGRVATTLLLSAWVATAAARVGPAGLAPDRLRGASKGDRCPS